MKFSSKTNVSYVCGFLIGLFNAFWQRDPNLPKRFCS